VFSRKSINTEDPFRLLIALLLVVLPSVLAAGSGKQNDAQCYCKLTSLYNKNGWTIPGLEGSNAESKRALYRTADGERQVSVTKMKPGSKPGHITWLHCAAQSEATEVQIIDAEGMDLWAFDIEGRVFAYGVTVGWLGPPDSIGHRVHVGTVSDLLFYDTDGSGRFVLMTYTKVPFAPEVPEWASRKDSAK